MYICAYVRVYVIYISIHLSISHRAANNPREGGGSDQVCVCAYKCVYFTRSAFIMPLKYHYINHNNPNMIDTLLCMYACIHV